MTIQMLNKNINEFPELIAEFNQILPPRYQLVPKVGDRLSRQALRVSPCHFRRKL